MMQPLNVKEYLEDRGYEIFSTKEDWCIRKPSELRGFHYLTLNSCLMKCLNHYIKDNKMTGIRCKDLWTRDVATMVNEWDIDEFQDALCGPEPDKGIAKLWYKVFIGDEF